MKYIAHVDLASGTNKKARAKNKVRYAMLSGAVSHMVGSGIGQPFGNHLLFYFFSTFL